MKRLVLLCVLTMGCGDDVATPDPAGQSSMPATAVGECVSCLRGLNVADGCDLCGLCRTRNAQGTPRSAIAGCLPVGQWCGDTSALTCRIQDCAACL